MADRDPQIDVETSTPAPVADAVDAPAPDAPTKKPLWRIALRLLIMLAIPAALGTGAYKYYKANEHFVSTDNALIQQDKVSVSAEISGRIVDVRVHENQHVRAGDLLFRVDPEPYNIAIAQADATIANAQVKVVGMQTDLSTKGVDIAAAREDVNFYTKEYQRQSELMRQGFTTRARLQAAEHALSDARSKVSIAEANATKARAALATGNAAPGVNPGVLAGEVQKRKAIYDLTKTSVRAPVDGIVSQADRLQLGQMMTQMLPALSIMVSDRSWVQANFKETDLEHMRIGQPAELSIDAYPTCKISGHIASIGGATGSEMSVLPAQNANGNWVKVTQRVPVRIAIDGTPGCPMIAGLSTHVRIDTSK